jgi:co-chaperonin GroES (HSP10)
MDHTIDPGEALLEKLGDLSDIEIFGTDVLLAVYQRPERTKNGLILPDTSRDEDRFQSKAHLVVKLGPRAFVDDDSYAFSDNERLKVGDWCAVRPSDGQLLTLNNMRGSSSSADDTVLCRLVKDVSIRMRVTHPDRVW